MENLSINNLIPVLGQDTKIQLMSSDHRVSKDLDWSSSPDLWVGLYPKPADEQLDPISLKS